MKKTIALLVVMLAFGLNANAQQKNTTTPVAVNKVDPAKNAAFHEAALKDIKTLSEYIKLTPQQEVGLKSLFENKHRMYAQNIGDERKAILAKNTGNKLKSSLTPEQYAKIANNTELLKVLTTKI
ncbi:hypothetical protein D3C87_192450 [compost metagenome]